MRYSVSLDLDAPMLNEHHPQDETNYNCGEAKNGWRQQAIDEARVHVLPKNERFPRPVNETTLASGKCQRYLANPIAKSWSEAYPKLVRKEG